MSCKTIDIPQSKICIGDLKERIEILVRSISPPESNSIDFGLNFNQVKIVQAAIKTVPNIAVFDQTNTEQIVSHIFYIRYLTGITAESWIKFKDQYYDIVNTENLEERNLWLVLHCNRRGVTSKPVNYA